MRRILPQSFGVAAVLLAVAVLVAAGPAQASSTRSATTNARSATPQAGLVALPRVVRQGATLREVDPSAPGRYLPGVYRFTGADAYELGTDWDVNVGCGTDVSSSQMATMMDGLGAGSVLRVWFFQQLATNKYTHAIDWTALDRVVAIAAAHGVRLIATLGNQDGTCDDDAWKSPAWYAGGYAATTAGAALSYAQWVRAVTSRYRSSPAILAWEPMNEPRPDTCSPGTNCWVTATCPSSAAAGRSLRSFFDRIGTIIRAADPNHLISDGAPAVGGCGVSTFADLAAIDASPGIDLISFHDYSGSTDLTPATMAQWSATSKAVGKPIFAGENGGLLAAPAPFAGRTCPLVADRAAGFGSKIATEFRAITGMSGWLFWDAMPHPSTPSENPVCEYATWPGDPLYTQLADDQRTLTSQRMQTSPELDMATR